MLTADWHPQCTLSLCVVIDQPELKHIDQIVVKQSHTAATTFILEAVKNNADKSTIRYASSHTRTSPPFPVISEQILSILTS